MLETEELVATRTLDECVIGAICVMLASIGSIEVELNCVNVLTWGACRELTNCVVRISVVPGMTNQVLIFRRRELIPHQLVYVHDSGPICDLLQHPIRYCLLCYPFDEPLVLAVEVNVQWL